MSCSPVMPILVFVFAVTPILSRERGLTRNTTERAKHQSRSGTFSRYRGKEFSACSGSVPKLWNGYLQSPDTSEDKVTIALSTPTFLYILRRDYLFPIWS